MLQIRTLYEREGVEDGLLTPRLKHLYDGDLSFPKSTRHRPYVIGNFVEALDGIVSFKIPGKSGGGPISGGSDEDRFVMGLLRCVSDAVLIGSGTLREDARHVRIPEFIYPEAKTFYANLRKKLGKPPLPLNVILTAGGRVDLDEPTFHTKDLQAVIVTTIEGSARIAANHGDISPVSVCSTGESGLTTPEAVLQVLAEEFDVRLLLHEGGPTIFGQFLAAKMIDELFLTLAPQVAGRNNANNRPSLAGDTLFAPEAAPWFSLCSVRRGSDHLLLRYVSDA